MTRRDGGGAATGMVITDLLGQCPGRSEGEEKRREMVESKDGEQEFTAEVAFYFSTFCHSAPMEIL